MAAAGSDEYSSSATITPFSQPVPLLRVPIKSPPEQHSYLLAFSSPKSWSTSHSSCVSEMSQQCEAGARIGCSISASDKCKPPWWKMALGVGKQDFAERAKCEEREMEGCLVAARDKCRGFSKDKCFPAFRDARVVLDGSVDWKQVGKLIGFVCRDRNFVITEVLEAQKTLLRIENGLGFSICRGEDLMGFKIG